MPLARINNLSGFVGHTSAVELLCATNNEETIGKRAVKLLTLYNPTSSDIVFRLQYTWKDRMGQDVTVRRFRDTIPSTDAWVFGTLGAVMVLDMSDAHTPMRLELVLETAPDDPIEWSLDHADLL